MPSSALKVGVAFGGRSVEHDVSIITGLQALDILSERPRAHPDLHLSQRPLVHRRCPARAVRLPARRRRPGRRGDQFRLAQRAFAASCPSRRLTLAGTPLGWTGQPIDRARRGRLGDPRHPRRGRLPAGCPGASPAALRRSARRRRRRGDGQDHNQGLACPGGPARLGLPGLASRAVGDRPSRVPRARAAGPSTSRLYVKPASLGSSVGVSRCSERDRLGRGLGAGFRAGPLVPDRTFGGGWHRGQLRGYRSSRRGATRIGV